MRRSKRTTVKRNYYKLNEGLESDTSEESESLDYEDFTVHAEEGARSCFESDQDDDYDLDREIQEALENEDTRKAEALLKEKEQRCRSLKAELKRERNKEDEAKKQKILDMQQKFKQLQKTENALNRSIASSRASTPSASPRAKQRTTPEESRRGADKQSNNRLKTDIFARNLRQGEAGKTHSDGNGR